MARHRSAGIQILPITGIGEVRSGEDLASLLASAVRKSGVGVKKGDILVVTHKIVSKAEGRVIELRKVEPSAFALKAGRHIQKDPRQVEVILSQSRRLVKMVRGLIIAETSHGFVCANAGVDQSNVNKGSIVLLPKRPDVSARRIRERLRRDFKKDVAVIISDTFGRPWREGQVDIAIGLSGINPFRDYRGLTDQYGYKLAATVICIADEISSAAELCMNKMDRVPAVIVRGYHYEKLDVPSRILARKPARDLFR